ncbi:MFS transporter [Parabacteroides sp. FAFU027]|uniref:MFS transporter n=1 Tax=Parabacteroides sp. FAFU027 TaxID=2922715 RepID=UPI001FB036DA|nr:MFS transporter [Parabacteroides sp. FAFU027]
MKSSKLFGLEKNIFYAGLTSFFTDTSTKMVYSVIPLFLLSIGASKTTISLIEGVADSTASLLKAVSGLWSDKLGRNKPFMIIGYGITTLVTPFYALAVRPVQVLVLRFIERAGKGFRTVPRDSLISNSITGNDAGRNFGFHKAMDNSGAIAGPFLASLLLWIFPMNYGYIFIWAAVPAFLGVLTIVFLIHEKHSAFSINNDKFNVRQLPRKFWLFLVVIFIFSLGNSTDALLLVKTSETGISKSAIPFIYMIYNLTSVMLAIPIGKLSDKIGREKLIIAGFLIYAVTYFLFGHFHDIKIFIGLFIIYGSYSALTDGNDFRPGQSRIKRNRIWFIS